jgi:hypothetical protein
VFRIKETLPITLLLIDGQLTLPNPSFKLFDVRKTGFEHSIYSSAHKLTGGHLIPKENVRNKLGLELKLVTVNQYYYLFQIFSYLMNFRSVNLLRNFCKQPHSTSIRCTNK